MLVSMQRPNSTGPSMARITSPYANAVPEAVDHSGHGAVVELRDVPNAEPGMAPMGIWCNEAQERYILIISPERTDEFRSICERERCPFAVIGRLTENRRLIVNDRSFGNRVVDMPMDVLLGKTPRTTRVVSRCKPPKTELDLHGIELDEAVFRILRFPAVADKSFLIHIGDRTVGGLSVRDQLVGPWQVPVSDVAITATGFASRTGEAMAMGERTPLATIDAPASGRMAVGEAITNIAAAAIERKMPYATGSAAKMRCTLLRFGHDRTQRNDRHTDRLGHGRNC